MDQYDGEVDEHNFSSEPTRTHRLPTLNGADALLDALEASRAVSTGLTQLDEVLSNDTIRLDDQQGTGLQRGTITEVYGIPGSGKTTLCMQIAAIALAQDESTIVSWLDTGSPMNVSRFHSIYARASAISSTDIIDSSNVLSRLHYGAVTSLPQLTALLLHPPDNWPPQKTSLLVIDDISNIVMAGLPQSSRAPPSTTTPNSTQKRSEIVSKNNAVRRASIISSISLGLQRLAATRNMIIVVASNTTSTRVKDDSRAILRSVFHSQQWNEGITNRVVLYRDRWPRDQARFNGMSRIERRKQQHRETFPLRVAEIERLRGREVSVQGIRFVITSEGVREVDASETRDVSRTSTEGSKLDDSLRAQESATATEPGIEVNKAQEEMDSCQQDEDLEEDLLFQAVEEYENDTEQQEDHHDQAEQLNGEEATRNRVDNAKVSSGDLVDRKEHGNHEIADSQLEDEMLLPTLSKQASTISNTSQTGGFLPSSQLLQQKRPPDDDIKTNQTATPTSTLTRRSKRIAKGETASRSSEEARKEDLDMLLTH